MRIAILPAGQWGTALAVPLAENGHAVRLWLRRPEDVDGFRRTRRNLRHLPGVPLPDGVEAFPTPEEALDHADLVILGSASRGLRDTCRAIRAHLPPGALVLSITKGLEPETHLRMSQVILDELPEAEGRLAVLSGPNFAVEVARRLPSATVVAAGDPAVAAAWQHAFMGPRLRVYTHDDVLGVELGGALKNVIAIGVGISDGLGAGENARAALITRGMAEIGRLGVALGANPLTFAGLSGIGDLVLTCTGDLSRNRRLGLAVGRGEAAEVALRTLGTVEGVPTARAAVQLAREVGVEMPITERVHAVLFEGESPARGLELLMGRERTAESWHVPA